MRACGRASVRGCVGACVRGQVFGFPTSRNLDDSFDASPTSLVSAVFSRTSRYRISKEWTWMKRHVKVAGVFKSPVSLHERIHRYCAANVSTKGYQSVCTKPVEPSCFVQMLGSASNGFSELVFAFQLFSARNVIEPPPPPPRSGARSGAAPKHRDSIARRGQPIATADGARGGGRGADGAFF